MPVTDGLRVKSHKPAITPVEQLGEPTHQELEDDGHCNVVAGCVYEEAPVLKTWCIRDIGLRHTVLPILERDELTEGLQTYRRLQGST